MGQFCSLEHLMGGLLLVFPIFFFLVEFIQVHPFFHYFYKLLSTSIKIYEINT